MATGQLCHGGAIPHNLGSQGHTQAPPLVNQLNSSGPEINRARVSSDTGSFHLTKGHGNWIHFPHFSWVGSLSAPLHGNVGQTRILNQGVI